MDDINFDIMRLLNTVQTNTRPARGGSEVAKVDDGRQRNYSVAYNVPRFFSHPGCKIVVTLHAQRHLRVSTKFSTKIGSHRFVKFPKHPHRRHNRLMRVFTTQQDTSRELFCSYIALKPTQTIKINGNKKHNQDLTKALTSGTT